VPAFGRNNSAENSGEQRDISDNSATNSGDISDKNATSAGDKRNIGALRALSREKAFEAGESYWVRRMKR
jgi:hypothetical protein